MAQTPQSSVLSRVTQQWNGILSNPNFKEKSSVSLRACLVWGVFGLLPYQNVDTSKTWTSFVSAKILITFYVLLVYFVSKPSTNKVLFKVTNNLVGYILASNQNGP